MEIFADLDFFRNCIDENFIYKRYRIVTV